MRRQGVLPQRFGERWRSGRSESSPCSSRGCLLIPAAAIVAAIRLAAPAKADDRSKDEADQVLELARIPADQHSQSGPPYRATPDADAGPADFVSRETHIPHGLLTRCMSLPPSILAIGSCEDIPVQKDRWLTFASLLE
jgi:hypothetical protein